MLGKKRFQQIASQMVMQKWWWIPWYKVRTVNNSKICDYTSKFPRNPKGLFQGWFTCAKEIHMLALPPRCWKKILPETNSKSPWKCAGPQSRKRESIPTIQFIQFHVSFREGNYPQYYPPPSDGSPIGVKHPWLVVAAKTKCLERSHRRRHSAGPRLVGPVL